MLSRSLAARILRTAAISKPHLTVRRTWHVNGASNVQFIRPASHVPHQTIRWLSLKSSADEKIEEITELFYTAQDEFEIAMEETEKVSVYAEEDRKAAREEFEKMKAAYQDVVDGPDTTLAEEVKKRIGHRIRELEQGLLRMEEMALNQD